MKAILLSMIFLASGTLWADTIVPGTCRVTMDGEPSDFCTCTFNTADGGSQYEATVSCDVLSCEDYVPSQKPKICDQGARKVTCVLSNYSTANFCRQTFPILPKEIKAEVKCDEVLSCLNDPLCPPSYCDYTSIRLGWKLEQILEGNKN